MKGHKVEGTGAVVTRKMRKAAGGRAGALALMLALSGCQDAKTAGREVRSDRQPDRPARQEGSGVEHQTSATGREAKPPELDPAGAYVCPPCTAHETLVFDRDGRCPVCGMKLIEKPDSSRVGEVHIHPGSGNFLVSGGPGHEDHLITVFYHRPESFTPSSPILIVVPGSGRNAHEYRDAWIEASEAHGVLVLSPRYAEEDYGFGAYHMGGLMHGLNLTEVVEEVEGSNELVLDEDRLTYRVNPDPREWIFGDFDRLFERVASALGSTRARYDLFGHSAGGQILHRLVLLHPDSKADRILAANSGFYTLPDLDAELPFGLENAPVERKDLKRSFGERLVLFIGEEDDEDETGGILLRSPSADRQGAHRLARARHFFEEARRRADGLGAELRWSLEIVPGVGHDHEGMSEAAAEYLYGSTEEDGP